MSEAWTRSKSVCLLSLAVGSLMCCSYAFASYPAAKQSSSAQQPIFRPDKRADTSGEARAEKPVEESQSQFRPLKKRARVPYVSSSPEAMPEPFSYPYTYAPYRRGAWGGAMSYPPGLATPYAPYPQTPYMPYPQAPYAPYPQVPYVPPPVIMPFGGGFW